MTSTDPVVPAVNRSTPPTRRFDSRISRTGIVVTCQNEKSQLQNKVAAMRVLQAKLLERKRLEERAELDALKGDGGSSWGNQMRSYVYCIRIRWSKTCVPSTKWATRRPFSTETSTDSWKRESGGVTEKMTTKTPFLATGAAQRWHDFWHGDIGQWIISRGLRVIMLVIVAILAVRFVTWVADHIARQLDERFVESDALVRSEASKHRQAVASVVQWVSIVLIAIWGIVQIADVLDFSVGSLVAPATVIGCRAGLRRSTGGQGSAVRILHHRREAVRLR